MPKYLVPFVLIGLGLCILLSPTGQVPRTALAFGEYKYIWGGVLVALGALFAYLVHRQGNKLK